MSGAEHIGAVFSSLADDPSLDPQINRAMRRQHIARFTGAAPSGFAPFDSRAFCDDDHEMQLREDDKRDAQWEAKQ